MNLQEFENIYDHIDSSRRDCINDVIDGITSNDENVYSKKIIEEIVESDVGDRNPTINIGSIISELVYRHIVQGKNIEKIKVLKCLEESLNGVKGKTWTSDKEKWANAIIYAELLVDRNSIYNDDIKMYVRECKVAKSAKKMISMGANVKKINVNGVYFEKKSLVRIIKKLDKKIKRFGGGDFIFFIFQNLSHNYSTKFERYFFRRNVDMLGKSEVAIPYGFLLNLALKHINLTSTAGKINANKTKLFEEIVEDARIIISGSCDVQAYLQWEYIYPPQDLIPFCRELVLWDSIFSIEQCRPSLAIEIAEFLFSDISKEEFFNAIKIPLEIFFDALKQIFLRCKNTHAPIFLKIDDFKNLPYNFYIKDIFEFLSHKGGVNNKYLIPYDYTKISYFLKPLIKVKNGYLIPNLSWAASTIFEALASKFRDSNPKFDSEMGEKIEQYLKKKVNR